MPYIRRLVAHPAAPGTGTQLVEQAVNLSEKRGWRGDVEVMPLNDDSQAFFEKMGFIMPAGSDYMQLEPEHSPKWINVDGNWRFRGI